MKILIIFSLLAVIVMKIKTTSLSAKIVDDDYELSGIKKIMNNDNKFYLKVLNIDMGLAIILFLLLSVSQII